VSAFASLLPKFTGGVNIVAVDELFWRSCGEFFDDVERSIK
jgi:hypothetical protein